MKKILLVSDGDHFPEGAFRFIQLIREYEPVTVKGLFLGAIDYDAMIHVSYSPIAAPFVALKDAERKKIDASTTRFKDLCRSSNIHYRVDKKMEEWELDVFVKESRFADLVVISPELFCETRGQDQPNTIMQELLQGAECPVLVVPASFDSLERLTFAYDGGRQSLFAIKQFTNLFPSISELPAEFIFLNANARAVLPDEDLLKEYVSCHFDNISTTKLPFEPHHHLGLWMSYKKNTLLVTGSYERSRASMFFRSSFAAEIIEAHTTPLFIAHFA